MMVLPIGGLVFPLFLSLVLGPFGSVWTIAAVGAYQLQPCQLINQTVSVEKEGCPKCHPIETTICSGHCITKDPVMKTRFSNVYQHVCTYRDLYHRTYELPDCPLGVDPVVTYPVALSCYCGHCAMDISDCTYESLQPDFCMSSTQHYY
ncbi:lutropin subunit beta [Lampris incognitus]|uniref:lutropin subunit beta n=1 Tax=Lampris incognitus TaxID=2546036 RepID=UPI0024B601F4|nr:lutropin subunit beta [Lampris incognitus]